MFEQRRAARAQQVRTALRVLCAAVPLCFASPPAQAEPSVAIVPLGFQVEAFRGPEAYLSRVLPTSDLMGRDKPAGVERFVAVWGPGGGAALFLHNGEVESLAWPPSDAMPPLAEAPRGALPGSRMQTAGPLTVFLSEPRTDYRHGALGDGVEAGRVTISERQPLGGHQTSARPVPVKTDQVGAGTGRRVRGSRAAPGRPRRRRDARDPCGQVLSRQGLGAGGHRPSRGRMDDPG